MQNGLGLKFLPHHKNNKTSIMVARMMILVLEVVENTAGKEENAGFQYFSPFFLERTTFYGVAEYFFVLIYRNK